MIYTVKTFAKSQNIHQTCTFRLTDLSTMFVSFKATLSVNFPCLKPNCFHSI